MDFFRFFEIEKTSTVRQRNKRESFDFEKRGITRSGSFQVATLSLEKVEKVVSESQGSNALPFVSASNAFTSAPVRLTWAKADFKNTKYVVFVLWDARQLWQGVFTITLPRPPPPLQQPPLVRAARLDRIQRDAFFCASLALFCNISASMYGTYTLSAAIFFSESIGC